MLKPEQIPDVVIEQAVAMRDRGGSMSDIIRTALAAWPGARERYNYVRHGDELVLPLPMEQAVKAKEKSE